MTSASVPVELQKRLPLDDKVRLAAEVIAAYGRVRLLLGMVRANRPWRLVPALSGAFAGALACIVGVFVAMPVVTGMFVYAYGDIFGSGQALGT